MEYVLLARKNFLINSNASTSNGGALRNSASLALPKNDLDLDVLDKDAKLNPKSRLKVTFKRVLSKTTGSYMYEVSHEDYNHELPIKCQYLNQILY